MSVEFEPVRLGPRRRRIDPLVVGLIVIVAAGAVAVVKPWEGGPDGAAASSSAAVASGSAGPVASGLAARPIRVPASNPPRLPAPTWNEIGPIAPHATRGIITVVVTPGGGSANAGSTPTLFEEHWSPSIADVTGQEIVLVQPDDQTILALGVTGPGGQRPRDLRIWRFHTDRALEWIDAHAIVGGPEAGPLLFIRPGSSGSGFTPWEPGTYRVDLLSGGVIRGIVVMIPGRFGRVPAPDAPPPAAQTGLTKPAASDPSNVRFGLFATVDGTGVPLAAGETAGPLDQRAAWLDVLPTAGRPAPSVVATAYLPRATGIGAMLTSHAAIQSASLERLAPDGALPPQQMLGGVSYVHGGTPWVVFAAPDNGAWAPGVYALSVEWIDVTGSHSATWHVELRPGPFAVGT